MINDPLDDRIAGFYRGQFLSQVRLQQLQSLGEEHLAAERKQPWSNHLLPSFGCATTQTGCTPYMKQKPARNCGLLLLGRSR